jgi:hypothetical protein
MSQEHVCWIPFGRQSCKGILEQRQDSVRTIAKSHEMHAGLNAAGYGVPDLRKFRLVSFHVRRSAQFRSRIRAHHVSGTPSLQDLQYR